jgi:hypothetical protein
MTYMFLNCPLENNPPEWYVSSVTAKP